MSAPVISVIMPVYNCSNYVYDAVKSILDQTFTDFELLIFDDASTDDTVKVIASFSDPRIRIIKKEKNSGYTDSLNAGIEMASGKYIARMDGDDISETTRFAKQVAFMDTHPDVLVCGTWFTIMNTDYIVKHPVTSEAIRTGFMDYCVIGHPCAIIRRDVFMANNYRYNPAMEPAEDYDLWTRLIGDREFANLPESLLQYRMHSNQISSQKSKTQRVNTERSQLRMLHYLIPEASEDEQSKHLSLIYGNNVKTVSRLKEVMAWADIVSSENQSRKFYNQSLLDALLLEKKKCLVRNFFLKKPQQTPATIVDLFKMRYHAEQVLSKSELMKLLIKSAIFWKSKSHAG